MQPALGSKPTAVGKILWQSEFVFVEAPNRVNRGAKELVSASCQGMHTNVESELKATVA